MVTGTHRVVIVGGGAGGLELASKLGREFGPEHIVLIDKAAFHIWKPSLHEVAAGTLDIHREGLSYFMLAKDWGFTFVPGEVESADTANKTIALRPVFSGGEPIFPARQLSYDTLVLAVGSRSNFFDTPGAADFAIALDSTEEAEKFRLKLLHSLARANALKVEEPGYVLNIVIVGGGATGVELAAELVEACADVASYGLNQLDPQNDVRITLIEGEPRILSALPEKMSAAAHQLLVDRGIAVKTSTRVSRVSTDAISDGHGNQYPAELCVWAAGIKAPDFLGQLGVSLNRINQVIVDAGLRTSDPDVYAFGDCAQAPADAPDQYLPARAQVAHQQARFLTHVLRQRLRGHTASDKRFKYRDYGSLVSIGHRRGIGSLMGVLSGKNWFIEGALARLMYMSLHLMHHRAILGVIRTVFLAVGRLMVRRSAPRVKLH